MITEMKMMCKDVTGWGIDMVGEKVNEIIRAMNAIEADRNADRVARDPAPSACGGGDELNSGPDSITPGKRSEDLKRRFDLIDAALDGLSPHDRFGLLGGMIGFMLQRYILEALKQNQDGGATN